MLPDWLSLLPPWLVAGLVMGMLASLFVASVFVVGDRLFPTEPIDRSQRIDGVWRRRIEIRDYLRAIDEQFLEDHVVHGETVAFYLPQRDVAITFNAQAYFRLQNADTFIVLVEHEMPGRHLGRRLPFEVPDIDPEPRDVNDPVARAFDRLGLSRSATTDEVKSAYRTQVKEVHPDHGGDREEFKQLREAYSTAKDHAR